MTDQRPGVASSRDILQRSKGMRGGPTYEKIKQAILRGELEPGDPLVETSLARWCGVSRTPVREALRRLEQDGLVNRTANGLEVRKRSPEEILDIYEARVALEASVSRVAAQRRTEYDLTSLRWMLEQQALVPLDDSDAMAEWNEKFHRAIWRASHNESLIDLLERVYVHLARYPGTTLSTPGRWPIACDEHRALVAAIEARDAEAAYTLASKHFLIARDIRMAMFAQPGTAQDDGAR